MHGLTQNTRAVTLGPQVQAPIQGEKDDPTGRASPPLAGEGHLSGQGGEPSLWQRFARAGGPSARATTLGAEDVRGPLRSNGGVGVEVLLEEPGREVTTEFDGPLLPLVEGHELILASGIEHQIEGGRGVSKPAPAESLLGIIRWGGGVVHGCLSKHSGQPGVDSQPSYPGGPSARTRLHPRDWRFWRSARTAGMLVQSGPSNEAMQRTRLSAGR